MQINSEYMHIHVSKLAYVNVFWVSPLSTINVVKKLLFFLLTFTAITFSKQ